MATSVYETLCQRCVAIDLDNISQVQPESLEDEEPYMILGELNKEWETSACSMCQFFISIIRSRRHTSLNVDFGVYKGRTIWRSTKAYNNLTSRTILDIRAVGSPIDRNEAFINISKAPESPSLLDEMRVDYNWIRQLCQRFYTPGTHRPESVDDLPLLVIDCSTRKLVPTSQQCHYIALSYVWGQSPIVAVEGTQKEGDLPAYLPATIEDTMKVVVELGFRYLWVDKYCLDNSNTVEFQAQLQKMAGIYRNAAITIVAAAGSDAEYGLPGVGSRHRTKQPRIEIGGYTLWSSMSDPRTVVSNSAWVTRAWTYQEGVCSKNLIFFTDEQVYYQSPNTQITHHDRGWQTSCEMFPDGGLGGSDGTQQLDGNGLVDMLEASPGGVHRHIERYVERSLSYQSDALNGMLGILKRCDNGPYPIYHYHGIPILGPLNIYRLTTQRATDRKWPLTEAFLVGLFWVCDGIFGRAGQRRVGFPSWSWTGWNGGYQQPSQFLQQYGLSDSSIIRYKLFVRSSGDDIAWEKYCSGKWSASPGLHLTDQELYLRAPTKMVNLIRAPGSLEGCCCSGTQGHPLECVAIFGDDELNALVQVKLTDDTVVSRLNAGETVLVKAIILRCLSLNEVDCSPNRGFGMRACALLTSETDQGAVKAGVLQLAADSYRVRRRKTLLLPESARGRGKDTRTVCQECATAMNLIMAGTETEMTKLI
ncbi:HET-domain-containing protein [Astrocystis sublimbata]|nr:HET-domain-containing protein [Astrocystis sublimbata]